MTPCTHSISVYCNLTGIQCYISRSVNLPLKVEVDNIMTMAVGTGHIEPYGSGNFGCAGVRSGTTWCLPWSFTVPIIGRVMSGCNLYRYSLARHYRELTPTEIPSLTARYTCIRRAHTDFRNVRQSFAGIGGAEGS